MLDLHPFLSKPSPLLVVISGPSGVGKDSVVKRMRERNPELHFVVTATTRPPRPSEVPGVDYVFVSDAEFRQWIHNSELLEHALVYGEYKGIPRKHIREALDSGKDVVMRLNVQGAKTVKAILPDALLIFLLAGSEDELSDRLRRRGTEDDTTLQRRLTIVRQEMQCISEFDYVVVNREGQLDRAVEQIEAIVTAERCRTKQRVVRL